MSETEGHKLWRALEEFGKMESAAKVPRLYRDGDDAATRARAREIEDLKKENAELEQGLQRAKDWAEDSYRGLNNERALCEIKDRTIAKLRQDLAAATLVQAQLEAAVKEANEAWKRETDESIDWEAECARITKDLEGERQESDHLKTLATAQEKELRDKAAEIERLQAHLTSIQEELAKLKSGEKKKMVGTPQYIRDIDFTDDLDRMANRALVVIRVPQKVREAQKVPFYMAELSKPFGQFKDGERLTGRWCELNGVTYQILDKCPIKVSDGNTNKVVLGAVAQLPSCRQATQFFTDMLCRRFPRETAC